MLKTENVEGFSVFKSSKSEAPLVKEENEKTEGKLSQEKKKFYQQLEVLPSFPFFLLFFSIIMMLLLSA